MYTQAAVVGYFILCKKFAEYSGCIRVKVATSPRGADGGGKSFIH